jgi:hypothetical protein
MNVAAKKSIARFGPRVVIVTVTVITIARRVIAR